MGFNVSRKNDFHSVDAFVTAPFNEVITFLRNGLFLSKWLVGYPNVVGLTDNYYEIQDPHNIIVKVVAESDREIYFHVGNSREDLQKRIMITVDKVFCEGVERAGCHLTLNAWRMPDMSENRWREVCDRHAIEIETLRQLLNNLADKCSPAN